MSLDARRQEFLILPGPLFTGISLYPNDGALTTAIRTPVHGDVSPMWLFGRASFFRSDTSSRDTSRTVRTEVTVERQGVTLLVGDAAGFDLCPLCGQKLAAAQAEQVRARLPKGTISQE